MIRAPLGRAGRALAAAFLGITWPAWAQEHLLSNDAFLPTAKTSQEKLAQGDALCAQLLDKEDSEREWEQVFELWRSGVALAENAPVALLPPEQDEKVHWLKDPDSTHSRRFESSAYALLRRLTELPPDQQAIWTQRFDALALAELDRAGNSRAELERMERELPATMGALRAALRLADQNLESARARAALCWVERAQRHADLGNLGEKAAAAVAARREALLKLVESPKTGAVPSTDGLELLHFVPLASEIRTRPELGKNLQPGLVPLADGRIAVQDARQVHWLDVRSGRIASSFEPRKLLPEGGPDANTLVARSPREAPGWPLLPATDGRHLILVVGTASAGEPNALMSIDPPDHDPLSPRPHLARLAWAIHRGRLLDSLGGQAPLELLADLTNYEFQPGPVVAGELLLAQVWERPDTGETPALADRRFTSGGEIRAWLFAFERASGKPQWRVLLAQGVEQDPSDERMLAAGEHVSAGAPLLVLRERVFVGTHLGIAAFVDLADGRLATALRTRRHPPGVSGWSGLVHLLIEEGSAQEGEGVLYAPADGDYLYGLRSKPDLDGEGLFLFSPIEKGSARSLAALDPHRIAMQSQSGPRPALAFVDREGDRWDAVHLGLDEVFTGTAAAHGERLAACTNRSLYLFDRRRELYLNDVASLMPSASEWPGFPRDGLGGSVYATASAWIVLGPRGIWLFGPDS